MKHLWRHEVCGVLALAMLMGLAWCGWAEDLSKHPIEFKDGVLMKRDEPFTVRAIAFPRLLDPATTKEDLTRALNGAAAVGANSVCFTLFGPGMEEPSLSPEALARLDEALDQIVWRRMGPVCRVFGAESTAERDFRMAVLAWLAKEFADRREMLYWVDGPDCAELVDVFRRLAPKVAVAAPGGADIVVWSEMPTGGDASSAAAILLNGLLPNPVGNGMHFVLPDVPVTYPMLDAALADPPEEALWQPDSSVLTEEERADGWIALFDGKTLDGWVVTGTNPNGFVAKDGAIEWAEKGGGYLRSRDRYDNFVLRLEYRVEEEGNSGIFLRAPRAARCSKIGMEFQINGDFGREPYSQSTGSIYDVVAPRVNAAREGLAWNEVEIRLEGSRMKAILNGEMVLDLDLNESEELRGRLRRGFIGLQDHGRYVAFRNIRIKPL